MNSIILCNYFLHKRLYHIFKRNGLKKKGLEHETKI